MKKILALVGVFLLFMGGVAAVLISMPPESWARHRVLKGVKDSTGLDLKINGPMSLRLMPSILLRMEDVALLNPAGAADKPVVTARVVEIRSSIRQILQSEHRVARSGSQMRDFLNPTS